MHGDTHKMDSFRTHQVGNSKAIKALHYATEVLMFILLVCSK